MQSEACDRKRAGTPSAAVPRRFLASAAILLTTLMGHGSAASARIRMVAAQASWPVNAPVARQAIVIGFVGGFIKRDDPVHSVVQLAARLRKEYPSGLDVETFENARIEDARKRIVSLLDTNHDGTLSPDEKESARIILYGHSWGASAVVMLAGELGRDGIPVLLTVQVDSVPKYRQNDTAIPANVAQAANFYQPDGFIHGEPQIHAADPSRTKILGNFRLEYKDKPYACGDYPWYDRFLTRNHTQIECDPIVWKQVEALIRASLPPSFANAPGA